MQGGAPRCRSLVGSLRHLGCWVIEKAGLDGPGPDSVVLFLCLLLTLIKTIGPSSCSSTKSQACCPAACLKILDRGWTTAVLCAWGFPLETAQRLWCQSAAALLVGWNVSCWSENTFPLFWPTSEHCLECSSHMGSAFCSGTTLATTASRDQVGRNRGKSCFLVASLWLFCGLFSPGRLAWRHT